MMLVTNTEWLADKLGHTEAVRMIARAGFDAVDCTFLDMREDGSVWCGEDWEKHALELRKVAEDCGVVFRQAHAPFPTAKGEEPYDSVMKQRIIRSMEVSAVLGIENIVVHPIHYGSYVRNGKEHYRQSVEFYRELIPHCQRLGIRVCTENMWSRDPGGIIRDSLLSRPEEFNRILDELNSPWIGGCLDIGHTLLVGQEPGQMIREMGKSRIRCLHVHDVDYHDDKHTMPFTQRVDWEEVTRALGQIDYRGDLTFEARMFFHKLPQALWADGLKMLERVGRYLIGRIEANRPE